MTAFWILLVLVASVALCFVVSVVDDCVGSFEDLRRIAREAREAREESNE